MDTSDLESGDVEFAHAVREAAAGLQSAHVELYKHSQTTSKKLIEYILSDQPLSRVDREFLAQFIAGEFRIRTGRKARPRDQNAQRAEIHAEYKAIMEGMKISVHGRPSARVAIDLLCAKYATLSREQIEQIVRHRSMRVSQTGLAARKKTPG